ncbi:cadherin-like domain-containing protein [Tistrella mobilis]|uniref:cadherin-like domain-containing protein n=1 Tax=Tistrella mobilis TaxID=171437 RepID=UPI00355841A9
MLQGLAFLYTGASTTMPGGDRVVSIVATDDSGDTDTQTSVAFERTIEVNAAPKVDTNTGTTVDEGGSTTITSAMLSSSDSEDTDPADVTYTLTTAPASGTLKLDGTTLEVGDTFTQKDIDDGLVTYDHDGSEGASGGFGFSVKDTTNLTLSSQSFAITISAVNDAPELTAPASIDVTEDTETALTGISISDVDAGTGDVTVTFTVGEGELAATSTADVTVGGTATALTLTGTVADINAFISGSGLTFTPDAEASGDVTLTIDVDDGGNTGSGGAKTDTATVTLSVSAVNDAPELTAPPSISVTEDVETALTGISISDLDAGSNDVTVTLDVTTGTLSATSGSGVTVGGTATSLTLTGTVTAINAFIAASGVGYTTAANATADVTLTVTVDDGGNSGSGGAQTDTATVTLDVTAVNDAPEITAPASIDVTEDTETALTGISISDVDAGTGEVTVTFTVGEGELAAISGSGVTVGGTATALTLTGTVADINAFISGSALTFTPVANANGDVTLTVDVTDSGNTGSGGAKTDTASVTLSVSAVNDQPTAPALDNDEVDENDAGAVIGRVTATDADGDTLTYTVDDARFEIVSVDGVQLLRLKEGVSLDYETEPTVDLVLTVTDPDNASNTTNVTITVRDDGVVTPLPVLTGGNVTENDAGAVVGTLPTLDGISYTVDDTRFEIVESDGRTVLKLKDGISLDREAAAEVTVTITATDADNETRTADVLVRVANVNEAPSQPVLTGGTVAENAAGVAVGTLASTDPDAGDTLTYTVDDSRFEVVGNVLKLKDGVSLDREAAATIDLVVTVTDGDGLTAERTVTVTVSNVNEAPSVPVFTGDGTVAENDAGAAIGTVTTSDPDVDDLAGLSVDDARFEIVDGQLKLKDGVSLDHESEPTITLVLTATDGGGLTATRLLTLTVTDVNEAPNAPVLDGNVVVENDIGAVIGNVSGGDPDDGDSVTYTVDDARFEIVGGQLKLKDGEYLDYEAATSVDLVITATDVAGLQTQSTVSVKVLDDTNSAATPVLSNTTVTENEAGAVIGTLPVATLNGYIVDDARFEVVFIGMTPTLKLKDGISLDHEAEPTVTLQITSIYVNDDAKTGTFVITVADANEQVGAPVLDNDSVAENAEGAVIGRVSATDPDDASTSFGQKTFTVDDARFEIVDGLLKLKDGISLDHETEATVTLNIQVTDGGGLSDSLVATINVTDLNETPSTPVVSGATVAENAAGAVIGTVTSTDPDAGDDLTYTVNDDRFEIVDVAGDMVLKLKDGVSLDHEAAGSVALVITATDTGGLSAERVMLVTVTDLNEVPTTPVLSSNTVQGGDAGAIVGRVTATDPDDAATQEGRLTFSVDDSRFEIVGDMLKLKAGESLSVGDEPTVSLVITATDGLGLASTQTVVLTVLPDATPPVPALPDGIVSENTPGGVIGPVRFTDPVDPGVDVSLTVDDARFEIVDVDGVPTLKLKDGISLDREAEASVTLVITATTIEGSRSNVVVIAVDNVNETPTQPVLTGSTVAENAAGAEIGTVTGSDPDVGDTLTFTVDDDRFEIVDGSLKLKDGVSLDHETEASVDLVITATDADGLTATRSVTITVTDVNEAPAQPVLSGSTVAENAAGAVIGTVTGSDPDDGDSVTFTVDDARFEIVDGSLKLKDGVSLDHEAEASVDLVITATDVDGLRATRSVTITVTDVNEAPAQPVLSGSTVAENAAGAVIGTVTGSDPDDGDSVTFTVDDDRFEIVDGILKLKDGVSLDYETEASVDLVITATDADGLTATRSVTITVTDVNEAPAQPVLTGSTVAENAAGAVIGTVTGSDPDDGDSVTFTVDDARFEIVDGSLKLKDGVSLDHEAEASVDLVITATDADGLTATRSVTITVTDVNEAPAQPVLSGSTVAENAAGAVIGTVTGADPDDGDTLTFTVDDDRFEIVDGSLKLKDGISLDYEMEASVDLVITATDGDGLTATRSVTITVTDVNEAPAQPVLSGSTVAENAAGAVIGTVTGSDPDDGDSVTFTVDDDRFEIVDGSLKLKDGVSLDYETEASVDLVITATDADGLTATRSVTITVTDVNETPTQPVLTGSTVAENAAGAVIGTVTGSDPDDGDSITFTVDDDRFEIVDGSLKLKDGIVLDYETEPSVNLVITATDGDGLTATRAVTITVVDDGIVAPTPVLDGGIVAENAAGAIIGSLPDIGDGSYAVDDARFEIVERDGVQLLKLKDGISLDHEAAAEVVVRLTATGGDGGTAEGDVTIRVTDVNEAPAQPVLDGATVAENAAGATIGRVTATDPDDPAVSFGQKTFTVDDARFEIVGGVLKLKDGVSLDHEAEATVDLVLTVTDGGGLTASRTVTLTVSDVNEAPAAPSLSGTTVAENAAGAVVGVVTCTDPDGDALTYTVDDTRFEIVDIDGAQTLKLKDGIALDHEGEPEVTVVITARDPGGLSTPMIVTLTVGDVNEAPAAPVLSGTVLPENTAGAVVGTVTGSDPDAGDSVTFTVDDARFEIVDGQLKLKDGVSVDFETEASIDLVITATDGDGLTATRAVTITVVDDAVTPVPPVLTGGSLAENVAGAVAGTLPDPAGGSFSVDDARFEIVDLDGTWTLKLKDGVALDHEAAASVTLTLTSTGSDGGTLTSTVVITVGDVNEAPAAPVLDAATVAENAAGASIGRVTATDPDDPAVSFGQKTFSVDDARFEIVGGVLKLKDGVSLDHEAAASIDLVLTVTDGGGLTASRTVTITVTDVNEAPAQPVLSGATVAENAAGAVIGTVTGSDPDAGDMLTFSVDDSRFEIVDGTLKLKDGIALDHEVEASVQLTITATDAAGLAASRSVTITVGDVNEAPTAPALDGNSVVENLPGAVIGVVSAGDPDAGDTLTYTVDDARFEIVGDVLKLKAGVSLDFETEPSVDLVITATDAGGLATSTTVQVTVIDDGVTAPLPVLSGGVVAENAAGALIGTLPGGAGVSYTVDDARFEIIDRDGVPTLKLKDGVSVDHEAEASITLRITSQVSEGDTATAEVLIRVTDVNEAPAAPTVAGSSLPENTTGAVVGRVSALDPDDAATSAGQLTFTVDDARFEIVSGVLKLKDGIALDHEAEPSVDLVLTVTDGGGLTASRTVTITVTDVNEAPAQPVLSGSTVAENVAGAVVGTVSGTDPDAGDTLTFTVDDARFEIVDLDGTWTLKLKDGVSLDYESAAGLTLVITATDAGGLTASRLVTVTVTDVNEAPAAPALDGSVVPEGVAGAGIGTVTATDPDDDALTYTVDDARFEIVDGVLKLKDGISLDAETEASVDLVITATDPDGLSASATVTITVLDDGVTPTVPVLTGRTVAENLAGGVIGTLPDPNGGSFSVDDARFEIVDLDGTWTLKLKDGVSLDHEAEASVRLVITSTAVDDTTLSSTVTITVSDVNEVPGAPALDAGTVAENAAGAVIGRVTASDPDSGSTANGRLTYTVDDARFEIVGGVLKLKDGVSLDHEAAATVDLVLTVTDGGGLTASRTVTITVSDVNEAPAAPSVSGTGVAENAPGAVVGAVTCTDPDGDALTYTVDDSRFEIVDIDGIQTLKLKDGVALDHESDPTVTLVVTARDPGGLATAMIVTLAVGDVNEAPTVPVVTGDAVQGGSEGAIVGRVSASDPDDPLTANGRLTYTVDDARFEIVGGVLKLKDGVVISAADEASVSLVITVTDGGGLSASTTVDLTVRPDTTPPVPVIADGRVPENAPGAVVGVIGFLEDVDPGVDVTVAVDDARFEVVTQDGSFVLKLKDGVALDHEAADRVTLLLTTTTIEGTRSSVVTIAVGDVNEAPSAPVLSVTTVPEDAQVIGRVTATDPDAAETLTFSVNDPRFEIVGGELRLVAGETLDHEGEPFVDLVITVTDKGGLTASTAVRLTVTDVPEAPTTPVLEGGDIPENEPGVAIGTVTADDPDGKGLTFTVDDDRFEVVAGVLKLKDGVSLDYETEGSVSVVITATAANGFSASETYVLQVLDGNDAPTAPVLDGSSVPENQAGAVIGTVTATDQDADDELAFTVDDDRFEIVDGQLKLKDGVSLDYETEPTVTLVLTVTDREAVSVSTTVTIGVIDDGIVPPTPVLDGTTVPENAEGAVVGTLPDVAGASYTVDDARFEVVELDGTWTLKLKDGIALDHEAAAEITLRITASGADGGTVSALVLVRVLDVDEAPAAPVLDGDTVAENAAGGVIGRVTATDPDGADTGNGRLTYGVDDARFEIVGGVLKLKDGVALDHEAEPVVDLVITVTDGGGLTATRSVTITVTDVNEAPAAPVVSGSSVAENAAGAVIGSVTAGDPDGDALTFTVDDARFEIVGGQLKLKDGIALDHEAEPSVALVLTATDAGGLSATRVVVVTVTDVNEAPAQPVLSASLVGENQPGAVIGTISASDPDGDALTFSVDDARFEIVDGQLKLKDGVALDFETEPTVDLVITAQDAGGLTSSLTVTITVVDDGMQPVVPVLTGSTVPENAAGAVIGTLPDPEGGSFTVDDARFEIVEADGSFVLKLKDGIALDHEAAATIDLVITSTDIEGHSLDAPITIRVTNVNEAPAAPVLAGDTVAENAAGGVIGRVTTTDTDAGDTASYAVDDARFEIVGGVLKLKDGVTLDHEAEPVVDLVITVTDAGGLTATRSVTITVTDVNEAPAAPVVSGSTVAENAAGAVIGTVTATDPDGDALSYAVDDARFEIVDGQLKLKDGIALDHEAEPSVTLVLTATDGDGLATTSLITLAVTNVNEAPSAPAVAGDAVQGGEAGAVVGRVTAGDPDQGDALTYTVDDARFEVVDGVLKLKDGVTLDAGDTASVDLVVTVTDRGGLSAATAITVAVRADATPPVPVLADGRVDENTQGGIVGAVGFLEDVDPGVEVTLSVNDARFEIVEIDGQAVLKLKDGVSLDHEAADRITLVITATTIEGSRSAAVVIAVGDVNEAPAVPVIDNRTVAENAPGAVVGTITVSDPDAAASDFGSLEVSVDDARFEVVERDGALVLKLKDGVSLDHEAGLGVTLTLTVADGGGLSTSRTVEILVTDVAEAPTAPVLDGATVAENAPGAVIGTVSASDPDVGEAPVITVDDARFEIVDGRLKLKDGIALDHEGEPTVTLVLTATDATGLATSTTVVITVGDVNEAPSAPVLLDDRVGENEPGGVVGGVSVDDPDLGDIVTVTVDDARFEVVEVDGALVLKLKDGVSLDYETDGTIDLVLTATDAGGLTASRSVTITVGDVDESPSAPVLDGGSVAENAAGGIIGQVSVDDTGVPGEVTWTVDDDRFEIVEVDGVQTLKLKDGVSLDHEAEGSVRLVISVTNAGGITARSVVDISVTDVNEAPVLAEPGTVRILATGQVVIDGSVLEATDPDGDALVFRFDGETRYGTFYLNGVAQSAGFTVSAADIAAGRLVYRPSVETAAAGAPGRPDFVETVTVTAGDGALESGSVTLTVAIEPIPVDVLPEENEVPVAVVIPIPPDVTLAESTFGRIELVLRDRFYETAIVEYAREAHRAASGFERERILGDYTALMARSLISDLAIDTTFDSELVTTFFGDLLRQVDAIAATGVSVDKVVLNVIRGGQPVPAEAGPPVVFPAEALPQPPAPAEGETEQGEVPEGEGQQGADLRGQTADDTLAWIEPDLVLLARLIDGDDAATDAVLAEAGFSASLRQAATSFDREVEALAGALGQGPAVRVARG